MSCGSFLFFSVVDIITLGGCHLLFKVGDARLHKDVVPLDEFLDVAVLHAVLIPVGQHLREVVVQLLGRSLAEVDARLLAFFQVTHGCKNLHQGNVIGFSKHSDVGQ